MIKAPTMISKKPKRIPNPPRRCIFCGGSPISREHIWAQWMRPYLPEVEQAQVLEKTYAETRASPKQRRYVKTTGDARGRKLKIVCIPCNSGWMSRLQEMTKPILSPLLVSSQKKLSLRKRKILATWATMFAMVYENVNPEFAATTMDQRRAFMKDAPDPPKNWIFWCAPFSDTSIPAIQIGFSTLRDHAWPVVGSAGGDPRRAQIALFGAGKICFCVFGAASDETFETFAKYITMIIEGTGFTRIWPSSQSVVRVTDRRSSPLTFANMKAIRDTIATNFTRAAAARG